MTFILFAFLIDVNSPILYQHIGWYTDRDACHREVRRLNDQLPHKRGVIGKRYYLCRCFNCEQGWG